MVVGSVTVLLYLLNGLVVAALVVGVALAGGALFRPSERVVGRLKTLGCSVIAFFAVCVVLNPVLLVLWLFHPACTWFWLAVFLAPPLFVLWKLTRSKKVVGIALLLGLVLPNARALATYALLRHYDAKPVWKITEPVDKAQEPMWAIAESVGKPESLFFQKDNRLTQAGRRFRGDDGPARSRPPRGYTQAERVRAARHHLGKGGLKFLALNDEDGAVWLYRAEDLPDSAALDRCGAELSALWRRVTELDKQVEALKKNPKASDGDARLVELVELGERRDQLKREWTARRETCVALEEQEREHIARMGRYYTDFAAMPSDGRPRFHARLWREDVKGLGMPLYHIQHLTIHDTATGRRIAWARAIHIPLWWLDSLRYGANLFGEVLEYRHGPGMQDFREFMDKVFPGCPNLDMTRDD